MRKRWKCGEVQLTSSVVTQKEHDQLLDEAAEILYDYLCQLQKEEPAVSEPLTQRTGSDG